MRDLNMLNKYRRADAHVMQNWGWAGDGTAGMFMIPSPIDRALLAVVASAGMEEAPWDHVSVSRPNRCPNWPEMEFIAGLFFNDDETAMQLHVPAADHVNNHPHCLHWWRPTSEPIPRPDALLVGVKNAGVLSPARARQLRAQVNRMIEKKLAVGEKP
jgi:hypothetical protein